MSYPEFFSKANAKKALHFTVHNALSTAYMMGLMKLYMTWSSDDHDGSMSEHHHMQSHPAWQQYGEMFAIMALSMGATKITTYTYAAISQRCGNQQAYEEQVDDPRPHV